MSRVSTQSFKLSHHFWAKREFNPASAEDLKEYQYFLKHSQWKDGCPFIIEWPHLTVTDMIQKRIVGFYLNGLVNQAKAPKHHVEETPGAKTQKSKSKSKSAGALRSV
jgi:hypothetical protein